MVVSFGTSGEITESITEAFGVTVEEITILIGKLLEDKDKTITESFMNNVNSESGQIIATMACLFVRSQIILRR